jgi:O-antigen/teichoic acid export membrane protein
MFFFGSVPSFTLLFVQKISLARGNYLESSAYVNGIYSISNIGILCASFLGNPLPVMIAMLVLLPSVVSSIVLFRMSFHFSKETTIEHFDWSFYRFSAFPFLVLQVATAVSTQVDSVLIGAFLGPIQVGVYAATFKFVSIAMMMISISLAPVWPTVSKLLNSENRKDVPKYIKGTVKTYSFIAILISLSFFFSLDYLTGKTYNDVFDLPLSLKVTVSIWIFVFVFWQLLSAFLNGFGMEMWLSKVYTLGAIASVSLSIVSIHIFKDISATVAASTFSCVAFLIFPMSRKVHRLVLSNE